MRVLTLSVVVKLTVADDEGDAKDAEDDALGVREALADGENVTTETVAERDITEDEVIDGDTAGVSVCETDRVSLDVSESSGDNEGDNEVDLVGAALRLVVGE